MKENFIRYYDNALKLDFCNHLIEKFEEHPNKHVGKTMAGVVQPNKRSLDLFYDISDPVWKNIDNVLHESAEKYLMQYIEEFSDNFRTVTRKIGDTGFTIRKYEPKKGGFDAHSDIGGVSTGNRFLAGMWYLNDIEKGGETKFITLKTKIKPVAGRFALFPTNWTHLHQGCPTTKTPKYIANTFFVYIGD